MIYNEFLNVIDEQAKEYRRVIGELPQKVFVSLNIWTMLSRYLYEDSMWYQLIDCGNTRGNHSMAIVASFGPIAISLSKINRFDKDYVLVCDDEDKYIAAAFEYMVLK